MPFYFDIYDFKLESFILEKMKKYNIELFTLTCVCMQRFDICTSEDMQNYIKENESVYNDLEMFFNELRSGTVDNKCVDTYFFPRLTEKEMESIEKEDSRYLQNFYLSSIGKFIHPDVGKDKMKESGSEYKFIRGFCERRTFTIKNKSSQTIFNYCSKVGCVFPMVVVSILPHAEFGPNDHREDASHFIL